MKTSRHTALIFRALIAFTECASFRVACDDGLWYVAIPLGLASAVVLATVARDIWRS